MGKPSNFLFFSCLFKKGNRFLRAVGITCCFGFFLIGSAKAQVKADFSTEDGITSGCGSLSVHFIDHSEGGVSVWSWDFGDNSPLSIKQNPSKAYTQPGTYTVTLTVSNGVSSDTKSMTISVYQNPTVNFTLSPTTGGCYPLMVDFMDNSLPGTGTISNRTWDFGDGSPFSNEQNPGHLYASAGKFTPKLSVTNSAGCESSFSLPNAVVTNKGITVDFKADDTASCTAPMTVHFTAATSSDESIDYQWDFGDGNTGTGKNTSHTYTSNDNYTVILTASVGGGGCKDQVIKKDYIHVGTYKVDFEIPQGCANVPLTFKNTSSPLPQSATWKFEDGGTASGLNAKHAFDAPGTYKVTLINNYGGCTKEIEKSITTYSSPKADFTVSQKDFCDTPAVVNFKDRSTGATSWKWTFGDKSASSSKEPSHTYEAGGDFDIQLLVTNDKGCADSITKNNFIHVDAPDLKFNATKGFGCIPLETTFELPAGNQSQIKSYQWDFGDPGSPGNTSTAARPTHKYEKEGAYTVTLKVKTASGCELSFQRENYIHVGEPIVVKFDATPKETCLNTPVQFTNQSQPEGKDWKWIFPNDGGVVDRTENPSYTFKNLGPQTVILMVNSKGCYSYDTIENFITVEGPKAFIKPIDYSCEDPYTFQFYDGSEGAKTWHWDFGDGKTSTEPNPNHTYSSGGAKKVTLAVSNGSCSDTFTRWTQILDEDVKLNTASDQACKGNQVMLTADNIHIPEFISSLTWNNGNGEDTTTNVKKGDTPTVDFTYDKNGKYTPSLIVKYRYSGCLDTIQGQPLTVQGPTAGFSMSEQEICQGTRVSFTDHSNPDPASVPLQQWIWNYGDDDIDTSATGKASHDFTKGGVFNVQLTVTDANGCSDKISNPKNNVLTVHSSKASFSTPDTMVCPGTPINWNNNSEGNVIHWKWNFGDGAGSTDRNPEHAYTLDSNYTVRLYIETDEGCRDSLIRPDYIKVGAPLALMKDSSPVKICRIYKDTSVNLSKNYSNILWDFGDGSTATQDTAYHIYNTPGTYTQKLIVNGYSSGCRNTVERQITITGPIGKATLSDSAGCFPLAVQFSAKNVSRAVKYQWYFGNGDASTPATTDQATYTYEHPGIYHPVLQLTDEKGCDVFIPINDSLNVIVDSIGLRPSSSWPEVCDSNSIQFDMKGSVFSEDSLGKAPTYVWDFGDPTTLDDVSTDARPTYRYPKPGVYYPVLKVNTAYNCVREIKDTITIPDSTLLKVKASIDPEAICVGDSITLRAASNIGTSYKWTPSENMATPDSSITLARPQKSGVYTVTAFSNANCQTDTSQINVIVHDNPHVTTDSVLHLPTGTEAKLSASGSPDITSWKWTPSDYLNCTDCQMPTTAPRGPITYEVSVMNQFGCTDSASVKINLSCAEGKVFIPNTFTPNHDGTNDVFYPRGLGVKEVLYFRIYNRWGQLVYERTHFQMNEKSAGWNGTVKGSAVPPGVFVYQSEMICDTGKRFTVNGNVTLIR